MWVSRLCLKVRMHTAAVSWAWAEQKLTVLGDYRYMNE